jgi:hypothetical protein
MKQIGRLWPYLLILMVTTTSVRSREVVSFSIYDEFGDIMFNAPGKIVLNGQANQLQIDTADQPDVDLEKFRYRTDTYESAYQQGMEALSSYRKKQYQKKVWKFRPLEEDKKTIIKIDEPQVPGAVTPGKQQEQAVVQPPMMSPVTGYQGWPSAWSYPWGMSSTPSYLSPYGSTGYMTPAFPMMPGTMTPGMITPGMPFPWLPYR